MIRDRARRVGRALANRCESVERGRGESGYILIIVLAAMMVGFLLITALLGLSFTTHRSAMLQRELAREQRAADGALDTAVTRSRAAAAIAPIPDPCEPFTKPVGNPELGTIRFTDGLPAATDDIDVKLRCDHVLDTQGTARGSVQIVGDEYTHDPLADAKPWLGWDWSDALDPAAAPDASLSPTLVHSGKQPLRFIGGVSVKKGAAPLIDGEDAVLVDGAYKQGDLGYLGDSANPCGMLNLAAPSPTPRTAIVDDDGAPECHDPGFTAPSPVIHNEDPSGWPGTSAAALVSCPGGQVVELTPGDYGTAQVKALNALFNGSCKRVYHFNPGDYYFDVAGTTNALTFADKDSAFVFGTMPAGTPDAATACDPSGPGVHVVFSGRSTFKHLAGNVSLCGNGGSPALVQSSLAPSGLVFDTPVSDSNCGPLCTVKDFSGAQFVTAPANGPNSAVAKIDCSALINHACLRGFSVGINDGGGRQVNDLSVIWTSSETPPAHASNRSLLATLTAADGHTVLCKKELKNSGGKNGAGRTPGFYSQVTFPLGDPSCTRLPVGFSEGELDGAKLTMQFSYPYGTFLGGETLKLSVRGLDLLINSGEGEATDATSPAAPTPHWNDPAGAKAAGGTAAQYDEPCGINKTYTFHAWPTYTINTPYDCWRTDPSTHDPVSLTLSDFDFVSGSGNLKSTDTIDRLLVAVDNADFTCPSAIPGLNVTPDCSMIANQLLFNAPGGGTVDLGATHLDLQWDDENGTPQSCSVPMDGNQTYTWSVNTYLIDLTPPGSDCATLLSGVKPISTLDHAKLKLSISPERGIWFKTFHGLGGFVNRFEWVGLKLPDLDHVRLVATTETVHDVVRATITADEATNTRFRVIGDAELPKTSLNLNWKGTGTPGIDSIFQGSLMVDSMASVADGGASVGVVCCGEGQKVMRLVAEIEDRDSGDWVPRGVAKVMLEPSATPRTTPGLSNAVITGWDLCGRSGCDIAGDNVLTTPP